MLPHHLMILGRSSSLQMPSQAARAPRAEMFGLSTGLNSRRHEDGAVSRHQDWDADEDNGRVMYEDKDGDMNEGNGGFDEEYYRIWEALNCRLPGLVKDCLPLMATHLSCWHPRFCSPTMIGWTRRVGFKTASPLILEVTGHRASLPTRSLPTT